MQVRKGKTVRNTLGVFLWGAEGTAKSSIALQSMYLKRPDGKPFRVLYIDAESGSIDSYVAKVAADGIDTDNLVIFYTQSYSEVVGLIERINKNENFYYFDDEGNETEEVILDADGKPFRPDCVVIDGLSVLYQTSQQSLVEFSRKRASVKCGAKGVVGDERTVAVEGSFLELKDYNKLAFQSSNLILSLTASNVSYVVTGREKAEKESKHVGGQIQSVATGKMIPDAYGKSCQYNCKTEIRLFRTEDEPNVVKGFVIKDRSMTYTTGETVEEPSLLDFQKTLDSTAKMPENIVRNTINQAVETETKLYENGLDKYNADAAEKSDTEDLPTLIEKITEAKNGLSPVKKQALKSALQQAGLPTTFKTIKDVATVKAIAEEIAKL